MNPLTDLTNRRAFTVVALKRTGHHAVIHWLLSHFHGDSAHLNNVEFLLQTAHGNPPPRVISRTEHHAACGGLSSAIYKEGVFQGHIRHVEAHQDFSHPLDRLRALANTEAALRLAYRLGPTLDAFLCNFEDLHLHTFLGLPAGLVDRGPSVRADRLVVLRDLPNLVASRLAGGYLVTPEVVDAWVSHVEASLAPERHPDLHFVHYPAWHASEAYRRALAERLDLAFDDRGRNTVVPFGPVGRPGSSFDQLDHDGHAQGLATAERWRGFVDHPAWRAVCLDPTLRRLSADAFGTDLPAEVA